MTVCAKALALCSLVDQVNFMDDYPEELFSEAMLQAMMQMDPECLEWKEKMERGYQTMREHGMRLQKSLEAYQKAMDDYKTRKAVPCKKDCPMSEYSNIMRGVPLLL